MHRWRTQQLALSLSLSLSLSRSLALSLSLSLTHSLTQVVISRAFIFFLLHSYTHIDGGHSNWLSRTFSPEQEEEEEEEEDEEETSMREELDSALEFSRFVAR